MLRFILKAMKLSAIGVSVSMVLGLLCLSGCQSSFIYFPRAYQANEVERWTKQSEHKVLDYRTSDGPQKAYLLQWTPKPEHLWIVCGGNGTVALDWSDWISEHGSRQDAWLLLDMPGYGANAGSPSPWSIRRSLKAVVPAATDSLHWSLPADQGRLRFFGHSLGSAVCLMAAKEYDIRRGVLMSPFTSTMDMTREVIGVPLGFLLWHRYDNLARLREIEAAGSGRVVVLHGTADEVIPTRMSRDLAAVAPQTVRLVEIPGGRHNDLPEIAPKAIEEALATAREDLTITRGGCFSIPPVPAKDANPADLTDPSDLYFQAYLIFKEGEKIAASGDTAGARAEFQRSRDWFVLVKNRFPTWKPDMVAFRLKEMDETILQFEKTSEPPRNER